ncbi:uncharacterized protein LOC123918213 isoform X4 [Trifolium pratense]|uniref:uncharacterized protein LOC123918213 isoform X4 n=1 Tax=Trifolium pratense TaxID=57577 RepID=UPI001E690D8F|nr:uncharacterized protein LOC123918213 isoform X4 [Trifolium pratense]
MPPSRMKELAQSRKKSPNLSPLAKKSHEFNFGFWQQLWVFVVPKVHLVSWTRSRMIELVSKRLATLERNHRKHMCISMELVAAVFGDHGQRPHEDYGVATSVTELGNGKPKFYSTRDNLFLHKMASTNKSRVVVLNKKISLFLLCCL